LKTLRTAHPQIWRDEEVKNIHYILDKPWNDNAKMDNGENKHMWWWKADEARRKKEKEVGLSEPDWGQTMYSKD
jgi:hypothetical protein